jgi:effector-binding domain-containing protein
MIDPPRIVELNTQLVAKLAIQCARDEMTKVMGPAYNELMMVLAAQLVTPLGPWYLRHLSFTPGRFDFEIGVPVAAPVREIARVKTGTLPAVTAARTIYHGPYEGLSGGWLELDKWIAAQGRKGQETLWETYLTDARKTPDPATWMTELTRPLV